MKQRAVWIPRRRWVWRRCYLERYAYLYTLYDITIHILLIIVHYITYQIPDGSPCRVSNDNPKRTFPRNCTSPLGETSMYWLMRDIPWGSRECTSNTASPWWTIGVTVAEVRLRSITDWLTFACIGLYIWLLLSFCDEECKISLQTCLEGVEVEWWTSMSVSPDVPALAFACIGICIWLVLSFRDEECKICLETCLEGVEVEGWCSCISWLSVDDILWNWVFLATE